MQANKEHLERAQGFVKQAEQRLQDAHAEVEKLEAEKAAADRARGSAGLSYG